MVMRGGGGGGGGGGLVGGGSGARIEAIGDGQYGESVKMRAHADV